jgi:uncharacterized RDD family membrane protein YckC
MVTENLSPFSPPRANLEAGSAQAGSQPLATRGSRFVAVLLDGLVLFPLLIPGGAFGTTGIVITVVATLAFAAYQIYLLSTTGQTLGKRWMKIRIVNLDGSNPGFTGAVLTRMIVNSLIGIVPLYSLVDVLFIFSQDQRCIHDKIAGTRVVVA